MTERAKNLSINEVDHAYICRKGVHGSLMQLNAEPTAEEMAVFAKIGFERATLGERFRRTVRCPVNGDGYWYTRREMLDSAGEVIGSVCDEHGPSGEL